MLKVARDEVSSSLIYRTDRKGAHAAGIFIIAHPRPCSKATHGARAKVPLHPQRELTLLKIIGGPVIGSKLVAATKIPPGPTRFALQFCAPTQAPEGSSLDKSPLFALIRTHPGLQAHHSADGLTPVERTLRTP